MLKKFLLFLLIAFILMPFIPSGLFAAGFSREIDVYEDNFRLSVEGMGFSHKNVFLFDGDFFLPINDLGSALGLGVNLDLSNRVLALNSYGRLSFSEDSKYPISYQRGYEIDSKLRLMDYLNKEIDGVLSSSNARSVEKPVDLRTITVGFSNIKVLLDGKDTGLGSEAFIYSGDFYLPLTALSPYLYITPILNGRTIDIDAHGVLMNKLRDYDLGYFPVEELVAYRERLNNKYARELEELNKRKRIVMDVKIPYEETNSLRDMERYLNKYLSRIGDLNVNIKLRLGTGHWYYVDIDFSSRYRNVWRDLNRRDVESHIWNIYVAISSLYDEEARLQGNIKRYVSFDTKGKNMVFSFIDSELSLDDKVDVVFIEDLLQQELYRYDGVYFDYDARMSGYDLELTISPSRRYFMDKWYPDEKLDYLEKLNNEIKRYYPGLKVNGKIVYSDFEPIDFTIENSKVRSQKLLEETSEYLNENYGVLYTQRLRIPIEYNLLQTNIDDFKLIVNLDYSTGKQGWDPRAKDQLADLMHDVMIYVVNMWDANVFVQVFDKSQYLVYEYVISQDTVQMVVANPSSGEVVEGSSITLSTATDGARIYYTTDGTIPSLGSHLYTLPIAIGSNNTIKAFATKEGFKDSPIATFEYTVMTDEDMASGLDSLSFSDGSLSPSFSKREPNYTLNLPYGTSSVSVIPRATTGSILVNDKEVLSGNATFVDMEDKDVITIIHKVDGKAKDKIYNIIIHINEKVESDVGLRSYSFNTFAIPSIEVYQYFSGQLNGNYRGHEVWILSTTGKKYSGIVVDIDGSFEITDFPVDVGSRAIGYKYEVLDPDGNVVDSSPLSER